MSYNSNQYPATSESDLAEQPGIEFTDSMFNGWLDVNASSLVDTVMYPGYQWDEVDELARNTIHQGEPSSGKRISFVTF